MAEDLLRVRIAGGPLAAAAARRALARLRVDLDAPLLENVRLLVTELVTNSIRHTGTDCVDLLVLVASGRVRVEVTDSGSGFVHRSRARARDEDGGWGLFLVERLADRWGVAWDAGHARVWFELPRA